MAKVSIIVPVYNTQKVYLEKCIDSLIKQSEKELEIIVVDDGSTQEIAQICDDFLRKDERIQVVHQKNAGVSAARNQGIYKASGDWITFVDADDWLEERAIEKFLENSKDLDVVISKHFEDDEKKEIDYGGDLVVEDNSKEMINNLFLDFPKIKTLGAVWGKMYNRKILMNNNIFFEKGIKMGEDFLFNFEVFLNAKRIGYISEYLYHYRRTDNPEAVTQKFDKKMYEKFDLLLQCFERKFKDIITGEYKEQYDTFVIRQLYYLFLTHIYNVNNSESSLEKKNKIKELAQRSYYKTSIKDVKLKLLSKRKRLLVVLLNTKLYGLVKYLY